MSYPDQLFAVKAGSMYDLLAALPGYEHINAHYAFGEFAHASFKKGDGTGLQRFLEGKGLSGVEIRPVEPTIEDAFIKMLQS